VHGNEWRGGTYGARNGGVRISPFDPRTASETECAAYAGLVDHARRHSTPDGIARPAAYVLNRLRHRGRTNVTTVRTLHDGDVLTGAIEVSWQEVPDNRNRSWVTLDLPVHSGAALAALAAAAAEVSLAADRPLLTVETAYGSAQSAWVAAHGGRRGSVEEHNVVRLASLSHDDVSALAAAAPTGYEALVWDGGTPDDLLGAYARLVETMNTAPFDDLTFEDFTFSPELIREWEATLAARGHDRWVVVAREAATGALAGFNELVVRPEWPEVVENEDTAVAVPHRGHGIGLWIKAVNLLRVLDERPEAVCVETWNAASNEHMLRVNRRLGFVPEHLRETWELDAAAVLSETQPA
jgi:RimJ/RimL family protein N-acetyltransferase